jgi:hypothetical protein
VSEKADAWTRAVELMSRASDAGARGELQEALRLADEAMSVAVHAGDALINLSLANVRHRCPESRLPNECGRRMEPESC